ncbi:uncharacterized protein PFLUO_LOCUS1378 [Penicillium psychrofluorescens]|uniref:uncharacterized protein n=1 Tax=Penicillium psychrofluorescens TaxID=3158075 RepID=UPI003CCDBA25
MLLSIILFFWAPFPLASQSCLADCAPFGQPVAENASYDYVVVGGGTAGVTIGARLAQQGFQVAVVEAGGYYEVMRPITSIPGAASLGAGADVQTATSIDWKFVANRILGANDRDIHYPRGKCVGGSSAVNFMIYQRPTRDSMARWAELVDDPSYLFENVLPFYKKTIAFTPPDGYRFGNATVPYNHSSYDNTGQPVEVSYPRYAMPFSTWVSGGLQEIGLNETQDFNDGKLMGHQFCVMTIRESDQTRSSSESGFLRGSLGYTTLSVYQTTLAKKILFDAQKRAVGVEVEQQDRFTLTAIKEVIVSAGAFQSPQLLMVSGIGPAATLQSHGINVIADLPGVGQNMWDHTLFGPSYRVAVDTFTKLSANPWYYGYQITTWTTLRTGVLTNPSTDYIGFEKLPLSSRTGFSAVNEHDLAWFPADWPEIEYLAGSAFVGNFSDPFAQQPRDGYEYATIIASMVSPTSRGNVTIRSADTADLPVINPNWLATDTDQKVAVAAYKRIRAAFQSNAMAPVIIGLEYFPGPSVQTDADILEIIRNTVMTIYHAACTCKMGLANDSMAVVDSHARVFGVQGLRVVDASAFPILPPGHPQSTVYMLAEKIAADIAAS